MLNNCNKTGTIAMSTETMTGLPEQRTDLMSAEFRLVALSHNIAWPFPNLFWHFIIVKVFYRT